MAGIDAKACGLVSNQQAEGSSGGQSPRPIPPDFRSSWGGVWRVYAGCLGNAGMPFSWRRGGLWPLDPFVRRSMPWDMKAVLSTIVEVRGCKGAGIDANAGVLQERGVGPL
jgi:hypothetical protein